MLFASSFAPPPPRPCGLPLPAAALLRASSCEPALAAALLDALPAAYGGYDSDGSERGGDDEFNDMCEVSAFENAEMMGWDTCDDDYVGS